MITCLGSVRFTLTRPGLQLCLLATALLKPFSKSPPPSLFVYPAPSFQQSYGNMLRAPLTVHISAEVALENDSPTRCDFLIQFHLHNLLLAGLAHSALYKLTAHASDCCGRGVMEGFVCWWERGSMRERQRDMREGGALASRVLITMETPIMEGVGMDCVTEDGLERGKRREGHRRTRE